MLTITLPHIAIQKVNNGYVVQWQRKYTDEDEKKTARRETVSSVCPSIQTLLETIDQAALDVSEIDH